MEPKLVRAHIIVRGIVQGVYFRATTADVARAERVCGWVRNRPDGAVEAVLEGAIDDVERVISWCRKGPPMARVEDVDVLWEEYTGEFHGFKTITRHTI